MNDFATSVNVLDSILRAAGAEKYIENFKDQDIEASGLSLLNEEDLTLLGIAEGRVRKDLLNHCKTLQITTERKVDLLVDEEYTRLVLSQVYNQLNIHHANLTCALVHEDLALCEVNLSKPTAALLDCVESMENQIRTFEKMVFSRSGEKNKSKKILLGSVPVVVILGYVAFRMVRR